jgi:ParB-like chromosome segregation protein Spo0J
MADASFVRIPLDQIRPDLNQPRRMLRVAGLGPGSMLPPSDEEEVLESAGILGNMGDDDSSAVELESLAHSVAAQGILQPILVEKLGETQYQIVAGERRWLAARVALGWYRSPGSRPPGVEQKIDYDWTTIPAMVIDSTGADDLTQIQLIENIQRKDMRPREIGAAINKLLEQPGMTYRTLAAKLGRNTNWLQNMVTAASREGMHLARKLDTTDWQYVRRLIAQIGDRPAVYEQILARVDAGEKFSRVIFEEEFSAHEAEQAKARGERTQAEIDRLKAEEERKRRESAAQAAAIKSNREPRPITAERAKTMDQQQSWHDDGQSPDSDPLIPEPDPTVRAVLPPAPAPSPALALARQPDESDLALLIRTRGRYYSEQLEGVDDSRPDRRIRVPHLALDADMKPNEWFTPNRNSNVPVDVTLRLSRKTAISLAHELAKALKNPISPEDAEEMAGSDIVVLLEEFLEEHLKIKF